MAYYPIKWHRRGRRILSIRLAIALITFLLAAGVIGFMVIEGYNFNEAIYMVVLAMSTVGFGEVHPLSESGRIFASIFILLNIGIFAYAISAFSYYVIEGEIFKKMNQGSIQRKISKLENHIIMCGYGRHGKETVSHFLDHQIPFVVVERLDEEIEVLESHDQQILYIHDDATRDEVLLSAGIRNASALISALPDDAENLYTVLTARQLNPKLNIISRAVNRKAERKLHLAGANHVIRPEQIGGFYMATLVSKPNAIEFFTFITNEIDGDVGFEELDCSKLPPALIGKQIVELNIRAITGANIIGLRLTEGRFIINPKPETLVNMDTSLIVLGDASQLRSFREYIDSLREEE